MGKYDWVSVGLKILGVYFGVSGAASTWHAVLLLVATSGHAVHFEGGAAIGLLQPAVYLAAAFVLVCRTRTCLRWCEEPEPTVTP